MPATVLVGAQWGDEGKGKIVDLLSERADFVVRFQGGNNAGHTLVVGQQKTILHLVPSGALREGVVGVLGGGVVIDPLVLFRELDQLRANGRTLGPDNLWISSLAHIIMPYHRDLDGAREDHAGAHKIGTTRRGIGPAYEDKVARRGVRVFDLLDPARLDIVLGRAYEDASAALARYNAKPAPLAQLREEALRHGDALRPYVRDVSLGLAAALRAGRRVLFEGAQGTMLDLEHGTYPFVTSSTTLAAGACASAGLGPTSIGEVIGVTKAYATRVGEGPFPSEEPGELGALLRTRGGEFGATTGRPRRCGWLDLVALRKAVRVNGISALVVTKLDVLSGMPEIKLCTSYQREGEALLDAPEELSGLRPVYRTLLGWTGALAGARRLDDLPAEARALLDAIESAVEVPIRMVSVGPERDATIGCGPLFGG